ncbi:T-cell surface glycoprotein CD4 isoform X1 [Pitangus sulphuratus]|nr:T-cell surface glycoprotein CD4 isoform X1 [Pitangus sulphuratus]
MDVHTGAEIHLQPLENPHWSLISSMAQQIEQQIGIAGHEVTLPCVPPGSSLPRHTAVTWMYSNTVIWRMENNKHFKMTVSLDGHFLQNEAPELTLMHNSPDPKPDLSITLFNSNNNRVTPEGENKSPQKGILYLKKLEATDSGTWVCHVHSDSPLINQNISFAVKVLGFQNPDMERKYATVDSTVILSWHLNFQKIKWNKGFTGQLNWKQQESAKAHELLDFNVTALREQHETKKTSRFLFEIPERKPEGAIQVKLPKVHFNHSGHYQCQLAYKGRRVQSNIELVVMKVSANPVGPLSRGAKMTLICQVSGPLPPNAHLSWERVNGTQMDIKNSKQHEVKLEVNISAVGLWSCHLIEDNDRKISLHYHVGMEISITSLSQP